MENFVFYAPTYFAFGDGEEKKTGELVRRFGGTRVLLVTGGGSARRSGAYDSVTASLEKAGIPFVELSGDHLSIFQFSGAHYAEVCSQLLSMIILAFLVNLLDMLFSKEKKFFGWLIFRCLSVALSLLLHLVVTYLFRTYLPEGIVTYAPTVLLWLLLIMLAVGALKVVVGLVLATVNPIIGALYTFFFATLVGKQLSKAVLTTALLTGLIYALHYIGVTSISIVSAALIAYIPFAIVLILVWYLLNKLL